MLPFHVLYHLADSVARFGAVQLLGSFSHEHSNILAYVSYRTPSSRILSGVQEGMSVIN